jgi:hypothetical protein
VLEPVSLAAAVVSMLVPLLQRLRGHDEEGGPDVLGIAGPIVERLYEAVKARLAAESYAGHQLDGVEERPDSEARRQALIAALAEELEADPDFAADLDGLVGEARAAGAVQVVSHDSGATAGRDVQQHGTYVAGRDLTIGDTGPDAGAR